MVRSLLVWEWEESERPTEGAWWSPQGEGENHCWWGPSRGRPSVVRLIYRGQRNNRTLSPKDRLASQVCYILDLQHWIALSLSFSLGKRASSNTGFRGRGKGLAHCTPVSCFFLREHSWDKFCLRWRIPHLLSWWDCEKECFSLWSSWFRHMLPFPSTRWLVSECLPSP